MAAGTVGAVGGGCQRWRTTTTLAGDGSGRQRRCDDDDERQRRHGGVGAFGCGGGWRRRHEEVRRGAVTEFIYLFISAEVRGEAVCPLPTLLVEPYARNHTKGKIEVFPLSQRRSPEALGIYPPSFFRRNCTGDCSKANKSISTVAFELFSHNEIWFMSNKKQLLLFCTTFINSSHPFTRSNFSE